MTEENTTGMAAVRSENSGGNAGGNASSAEGKVEVSGRVELAGTEPKPAEAGFLASADGGQSVGTTGDGGGVAVPGSDAKVSSKQSSPVDKSAGGFSGSTFHPPVQDPNRASGWRRLLELLF